MRGSDYFKNLTDKQLREAWEDYKFFGETGYIHDEAYLLNEYVKQNQKEPTVILDMKDGLLHALAERYAKHYDSTFSDLRGT